MWEAKEMTEDKTDPIIIVKAFQMLFDRIETLENKVSHLQLQMKIVNERHDREIKAIMQKYLPEDKKWLNS